MPAIRDAFRPPRHAPTVGRLVADREDLRALLIEFAASGSPAL